jgi:hypothetical protein
MGEELFCHIFDRDRKWSAKLSASDSKSDTEKIFPGKQNSHSCSSFSQACLKAMTLSLAMVAFYGGTGL